MCQYRKNRIELYWANTLTSRRKQNTLEHSLQILCQISADN